MRPLDRKVLRELWLSRGQALAIALVVACAVAVYIGSAATYRSLLRTQAAYYDRYAFADVFAQLRRAPLSMVERVAALPGVAAVSDRVSAEVSLQVEGFGDPVTGRLISVPADRQPRLNRLYLRAGRPPVDANEVVLSEGFAIAHRLRPGDALSAVINGRQQRLTVVGIGLAPDFVYVIRPGELMPDDRHFGVLWMERRALAAALDMTGAFNELAVRLSPGASEPRVIAGLDALLAPWGGFAAHGRDQQASHRFVADEIRSLEAMALAVPAIFLGVAAFLLSVVLSRLIGAQRQQIGTLKALGFSSLGVAGHYAKYTAVIVLLGVALGTASGLWMGSAMTRMYVDFFRFPVLVFEAGPMVVVSAAVAGLAAAALGVGRALAQGSRLAPAEAMRPEPPPTFRPTLLERLGLGRLLSPTGRMTLRNLARRPLRALLSSAGIAASVSILVVGMAMFDSIDVMMLHQFHAVQREDATVGFVEALPADAVLELAGLPGVLAAEPYRAVAARLRAGHRSYTTALTGLEPGARLHQIVDARGARFEPPPQGLLLSAKLAETLGVGVGDRLRVEVLEGRRPARELEVRGLVDDMIGVSAWMGLAPLNALLGEGRTASGAYLQLDADREQAVYARLRELPKVTGVTLRSSALDSFRTVLADYLGGFAAVLVLFAGVIAGGVVYNAARISLTERDRELASLRVLGFTREEAWRLLLGELGVQVVLALPAGALLGYGITWAITRLMESELFRMPLVVAPSSYALAIGVVLAAAAAMTLVARRWIARLDLVAVLKAKE